MQLEFRQLDRRWEHLRVRDPHRQRRLLASLADSGQQTPIVVVVSKDNRARYLVIDGYKRVAALEQGWLLAEMEQRFGYGLDELARRFDRGVNWVSRRLALAELLPEAIQQQVREGKIAAQVPTRAFRAFHWGSAPAQCIQIHALPLSLRPPSASPSAADFGIILLPWPPLEFSVGRPWAPKWPRRCRSTDWFCGGYRRIERQPKRTCSTGAAMKTGRLDTKMSIFDFLSVSVKDKEVLDVGCVEHSAEAEASEFWMHRHLVRSARSVLGVDTLESDVEALRSRGYNMVCADATTAWLGRKFDGSRCSRWSGGSGTPIASPGIVLTLSRLCFGRPDMRWSLVTTSPAAGNCAGCSEPCIYRASGSSACPSSRSQERPLKNRPLA